MRQAVKRKKLKKLLRAVFENDIVQLTILFCMIFAVLILKFPVVFQNEDVSASKEMLISSAQVLATIFAISVSFTLLGFQFLSQTYTPRLLREFIRDRVFLLFLIIYPISILLNFFSLSFPLILSPQTTVPFSFFLSSYCIAILVVYVFHVARKLQPEAIISGISREISEDLYTHVTSEYSTVRRVEERFDEPFIILEQFMIKTIENNDFFSYIRALRLLFITIKELLSKAEKEEGYDNKMNTSEAVFGYFRRIIEQIKNEAFVHRREEFLIYLSEYLLRIIIRLWKMKSRRALDDGYEIFESIGFEAVESRLKLVCDRYARQLSFLVKKEMEIIKEEIPLIDIDVGEWKKLSDEQKELWSALEALYEDVQWRRPRFVTNLCILASEKRLNKTVSSLNSVFLEMLMTALETHTPEKRRLLLAETIIGNTKEAHFKSVDNGINSTTFTTYMLHYHLETLEKSVSDPKILKGFGQLMTGEFCEMSLKSIEEGFYQEVFSLGVNGRSVISKHPEFADVIVDTLGKSLEIISESYKDEQKEIATRSTIKELKSLEHWNNHKHKEITRKIQKLLKMCKA